LDILPPTPQPCFLQPQLSESKLKVTQKYRDIFPGTTQTCHAGIQQIKDVFESMSDNQGHIVNRTTVRAYLRVALKNHRDTKMKTNTRNKLLLTNTVDFLQERASAL